MIVRPVVSLADAGLSSDIESALDLDEASPVIKNATSDAKVEGKQEPPYGDDACYIA